MRQNSIGETGALMLAKAVRRQGMLHTLAYVDAARGPAAHVLLADCGVAGCATRSLGKNYVGKAGAFSFAKLLRSCTCLKRLE